MPKKRDDDTQEGDRLPGEEVPASDEDVVVEDRSSDTDESDKGGADEPEMVEITMGGQTLSVAPEAAEAYRAQMEQHSAELVSARQPAPAPDRGQDDKVPFSELLYTDPDEAMRLFKEEIKDEVRAEYSEDQSKRGFWDTFYRDNPELRDDDTYVQAMLNKNWETLKTLPTDVAGSKLADLTKEGILGLASKYASPKGGKNATADLEGASNADEDVGATKQPSKESGRPQSLGDVIKQRNKARTQARSKISPDVD